MIHNRILHSQRTIIFKVQKLLWCRRHQQTFTKNESNYQKNKKKCLEVRLKVFCHLKCNKQSTMTCLSMIMKISLKSLRYSIENQLLWEYLNLVSKVYKTPSLHLTKALLHRMDSVSMEYRRIGQAIN